MIAYLILAHRDISHLEKLIRALSPSKVFLHVDLKSKMKINRDDLEKKHSNLSVVSKKESVNVQWGGYSQITAMILLIEIALKQMEAQDKLVFLSGSDYPIKNSRYIEAFFHKNKDKEFFRYYFIEDNRQDKRKIENYHRMDLRLFKDRGSYLSKFNTGVIRAISIVETFLRGKKKQTDFEIASGSQWFAVSKACALEMLSLRTDKYDKFFKTTFAPDEMFFATLFSRSSYSNKNLDAGPIVYSYDKSGNWQTRNITYVDETLDHWLDMDDLPLLEDSEFLFARKFDSQISLKLINRMEKNFYAV